MVKQRPVDVEEIVGQCWIVFGQGAGSMGVLREAITAGRKQYIKLFGRHAETWDSDALEVLEFVRAAGRLAAQMAADDGLGAIGAKHLKRAALRVFRLGERRVFPLADCPYCVELRSR